MWEIIDLRGGGGGGGRGGIEAQGWELEDKKQGLS